MTARASHPWHRAEWRLTVRATTGAVLAYLIATAFALPQGYWSVITALVVMQGSLGGTLGSAWDRMTATLAGAGTGAVVGVAGAALGLPFAVMLGLAVAPLAYLMAVRPAYRVAPVTAVIVLLDSSTGSALLPAMHRVAEIGLGGLVGILVSLLVLPSRANRIVVERTAAGFRRLGAVAALLLRSPPAPQAELDAANARFRVELRQVIAAAAEARREHATRLGTVPWDRLERVLRRLHSDLVFIGRAARAEGGRAAAALPVPAALAEVLPALFAACGTALEEEGPPPALGGLDSAIGDFAAALERLGGAVPRDAVALLFALEMLRRDLGDFLVELSGRRPVGPAPG
ncbi:FUSC family protein [Roseomonas sp. NAR14]|uniref:FUSC family protein n=1 Tax=Roseomonas acroporae TaxID=2937791 RepID=A0A9X1Y652_9PROT|nr:FUSC family protein [Roseomonas acroporae]